MDKYKRYVVEDFVLDAGFQNWVRYPEGGHGVLWAKYSAENPGQADDIRGARLLLESVYARFDAHISDKEIEQEISAMVMKIRGVQEETELPDSEGVFRGWSLIRWLSAASVLLVIAFAGWFLVREIPAETTPGLARETTEEMKTWQNQTGERETIVLEDGTTVVLEPGSELSIPVAFAGVSREVHLTGEAFFKVSRDVKRPFFVYSDKLITRVLGTSFVIRAFKSASEEVVEVKEGKVSVFKKEDFRDTGANRESQGLLVTSNQKVTLEIRDSRLVKALSDTPEIVRGQESKIRPEYVNTPVSEVLKDLKEAYQVDIVFDEDLLSGCPLTATLADQSLKEKLEIICEVIEAKYEILDGQVMIYGKSCNE